MKKFKCLFISLIAVTLIVCIINIIKSPCNFFNLNYSDAVIICLTICISFFASYFFNDENKKKDYITMHVSELQSLVTNSVFYNINDNSDPEIIKRNIASNNRSISNHVAAIKRFCNDFMYEKEIKYIESNFNEYKKFVGNHIEDIEYLSKSYSELKKYSDNINQKSYIIIEKLFN